MRHVEWGDVVTLLIQALLISSIFGAGAFLLAS